MAMEDAFETDSKKDDEWKLHSWSQQNKTAPFFFCKNIWLQAEPPIL